MRSVLSQLKDGIGKLTGNEFKPLKPVSPEPVANRPGFRAAVEKVLGETEADNPAFTVEDLILRGVPKAPKFTRPKTTNRISRCGPKSKRGAPVAAKPIRSAGGWLWVSRMPCPRDPKTREPLIDEWPVGTPAARLAVPVLASTGEPPTASSEDTVLRFYEPLAEAKGRSRAVEQRAAA